MIPLSLFANFAGATPLVAATMVPFAILGTHAPGLPDALTGDFWVETDEAGAALVGLGLFTDAHAGAQALQRHTMPSRHPVAALTNHVRRVSVGEVAGC